VKRTLRLSREVLSELTNDDLRAVNGGAQTQGDVCIVLSLDRITACGSPTCGRTCTGTSDPVTK